MSKKLRKDGVHKLNDDDLFGDFEPMEEFIASESLDISSGKKKAPDKFEITADDKKKKPGNRKVLVKGNVEQLGEEDLFGNFKPLDEYIESDSFEVVLSEKERTKARADNKPDVKRLQEDDLFGDFKPMDEFIESDSFEVTVSKEINPQDDSQQTSSSPSPTASSPSGGPTPPPISPISKPTAPTGASPSNSGQPVGMPQSPVGTIAPPQIAPGSIPVQPPSITTSNTTQPEVMDKTKSKLKEIAKKRKKQRHKTPSKKGDRKSVV